MLPVSQTPSAVEHRVGGADFSDFPSLASGQNLNFTSDNMTDLRHQGIADDDDNDPDTENIPYQVPQLVNALNCKSEGIVFPGQLNNLHHTYATFKNYSREEVMKMTKLELFFIIFPVDYLK